jgi:hypothetical protein
VRGAPGGEPGGAWSQLQVGVMGAGHWKLEQFEALQPSLQRRVPYYYSPSIQPSMQLFV